MYTPAISVPSGWASLPPEILRKNIVPYWDQDPTLIARMEQVCTQWCYALKGGRTQESPVFSQIQLAQNFAARRYEKMDVSKADTITWKESISIDASHAERTELEDAIEKIKYSFFYKDESVCLEIADGNTTPKTTHSIPLNIGNSIIGLELVEGALLIATGYGVHFFKRVNKNNISNTFQLKKITSLYNFSFCREFKISNDKTKIQFGNRVLDFASPTARIHRWDSILSNKLVKMARVISCLFKNLLPLIITCAIISLFIVSIYTSFGMVLLSFIPFFFNISFEAIRSFSFAVSIIYAIGICLIFACAHLYKELKENPSSNLQALLS